MRRQACGRPPVAGPVTREGSPPTGWRSGERMRRSHRGGRRARGQGMRPDGSALGSRRLVLAAGADAAAARRRAAVPVMRQVTALCWCRSRCWGTDAPCRACRERPAPCRRRPSPRTARRTRTRCSGSCEIHAERRRAHAPNRTASAARRVRDGRGCRCWVESTLRCGQAVCTAPQAHRRGRRGNPGAALPVVKGRQDRGRRPAGGARGLRRPTGPRQAARGPAPWPPARRDRACRRRSAAGPARSTGGAAACGAPAGRP